MPERRWHALSVDRQTAIVSSGITVGDFMERYEQPEWCLYPGALEGVMGCYSLVIDCSVRRWRDCNGCELQVGGTVCAECGSPSFMHGEESNKRHHPYAPRLIQRPWAAARTEKQGGTDRDREPR